MVSSTLIVEERLKERLTSQALNDPDFSHLLAVGAEAIRRAASAAPNEATIESAFERHLFTLLRAIGVDYAPTKEALVTGTLLRQSGRADSRFRDVLIEFKHRSELATPRQIEMHLQQLRDYMQALTPEGGGEQIGFLTDGLRVIQLVRTEGQFQTSGTLALDRAGLLLICRAFVAAKTSALRADNLVRDFCGNAANGHLYCSARELHKSLVQSPTIKTAMLRSEWESLFRLAHEDQSQQKRIEMRREALSVIFEQPIEDAANEYFCLFSLHTAYAIVVKLVAYKVVSDTVFGAALSDYKSLLSADDDALRAFCEALEDGELFRQIGILNLLEGDFFSWYADAGQWNASIAQCVRDTLQVLSKYESANTIFAANKAVDLFRQLYEAAIPQVVRGSFGEFYTPLWLAQHVLENSGFTVGDRVLDPCCGSGTFVIAALQRIRSHASVRGKALLEQLLHSVVGIDLNPLAVLTARIHFFIYISDLIERTDEELVIPVFLGDASNVPNIATVDGVEFLRYKLNTLRTPLNISLPMTFVRDAPNLFRLMNHFEALLAEGQHDDAKALLVKYCDERDLSDAERESLASLADQIIELERNQWNGIWARIIANFASTIAIGRFERIIGNPPWIDWKSLPAGYRDTVKSLCIDRGLFSGDKRTGGINLNVCALIAHVSATNWLSEGGQLCFLMPRELAVQPSYEGWRKSVGGIDCRIVEFDDWSEAGHPFEPVREDFMTFKIRRGHNDGSDVRCILHERTDKKAKPWLWDQLPEALSHLHPRERLARALVAGRSSFTFADTRQELDDFAKVAGDADYIGREGIEFYPQELVMFRYIRPGPKPGTVFVENFQGTKSKFKIPKQTILLETRYLFPLVKGPNIKPFEYAENDLLVAFPYDETDPHRPIGRSRLRRESPLLLKYFLKYEQQLRAQTAYSDAIRAEGEFYGLARTGPYSFASTYVAFRDNTSWGSCVITDAAMPWGERKRYLFQNHAVSMCERALDRAFITEDEAHYVCAILNSDLVEKFIYASSDERSFKIRPPVRIPKFDRKNSTHKKLAKLSRKAHGDPAARKNSRVESTRLYLDLLSGPRPTTS